MATGDKDKAKKEESQWRWVVRPTLCANGAQRMGRPQVHSFTAPTESERAARNGCATVAWGAESR